MQPVHLNLPRKMMVTRMLRVRVADVAVLKRRNQTIIGLIQKMTRGISSRIFC